MDNFKNILKGKVVIVGIGNLLRSDDAFGPLLTFRLKQSLAKLPAKRLVCLDAGTTPENYAGKIVKEKPDTVLLVDAVHLAKAAGEYEVLKQDDILKTGFTTHDLSPKMFIDYLKEDTKADIYMLGVQPESLAFGEEMTGQLKKTLNEIAEIINIELQRE